MVLILDMSSNEWDDESASVAAEEQKFAALVEMPVAVPRLVPVSDDQSIAKRQPARI